MQHAAAMQFLLLLFSFQILAVAAHDPDKFNTYFSAHEAYFQHISRDICTQQLRNYRDSNTSEVTQFGCETPCDCLLECMLGNTSETIKATMSSADVLLGLTPTILGLIGPKCAETALLSYRRPLLTSLVSFAAPSPFTERLFEFEDILGQLREHRQFGAVHQVAIGNPRVLSGLQYLLALGAIANVIELALSIDVKTVSSVHCSIRYLPIGWVLCAVFIHLLASIAFRLSARKTLLESKSKDPGMSFSRMVRNEFIICQNQDPLPFATVHGTLVFKWIYWISSFAILVQLVFGTLVFSALLFIGVGDGVGVVLRFMASAVICRAILVFEIRSMKKTEDKPE